MVGKMSKKILATKEELDDFKSRAKVANKHDVYTVWIGPKLLLELIRNTEKLNRITKDFRKLIVASCTSCVEGWAQSDKPYELVPEIGELFEKHFGFPDYGDETTDEPGKLKYRG